MTTLATVLYGSKLYGLDNAQSDTDTRSIHLPSVRDCLLLRATQNANAKEGEGAAKKESESFALTRFLNMAAHGDDVAVTLLHCSDHHVLVNSATFAYIRANRHRFYTKGMKGQVSFARSMAVKYALRADRLAEVERIIAILMDMTNRGVARLAHAWDELTESEYVTKGENPDDRNVDKRYLDVAGKVLPASITPSYALDILCALRDRFGSRTRAARNLDGNDWKALYQSFRVGYQLRALYTRGDFTFPLPESDFIRAVKEGRMDYVGDQIDDKLNALITEVEALAAASTYPESVDQAWLDQIVLDAYQPYHAHHSL